MAGAVRRRNTSSRPTSCVASSCSSRPAANAAWPTVATSVPTSSARPGTAAAPSRTCQPARATRASSAAASGEATRTRGSASRPSSSRVEACTSRPPAMITTSSTVCCTSDRTWEDTSTVRPCAASARSRSRSQRMPSGSRPFAGSSSSRTGGSPRRVVARASRWRMPSENPPTRRREAAPRPTSSRTSAARASGTPACGAYTRRWSRAVRPGWKSAASRAAPTVRIGRSSSVYRRPPMVADPAVGETRPRSIRRVVVLPAPLGPRNPVTRPGRTVKLRSSTARTWPNVFVRWLTSMACAASGGMPRP